MRCVFFQEIVNTVFVIIIDVVEFFPETPPQGNDAKCGFRVPHESEDERLRFHGLRPAVKRYEQHPG
jgi:hypothetical protein